MPASLNALLQSKPSWCNQPPSWQHNGLMDCTSQLPPSTSLLHGVSQLQSARTLKNMYVQMQSLQLPAAAKSASC